jgi:hypothetical protein
VRNMPSCLHRAQRLETASDRSAFDRAIRAVSLLVARAAA